MSIITSLYPKSHGALCILKDSLSPKIKTLSEILQMYDYKTIWYGPKHDPHLDLDIGFGRGFDEKKLYRCPIDMEEYRKYLFERLDKFKGDSFFLNFHSYSVHAPYLPPSRYRERFIQKKRKGIIQRREDLDKKTYEAIRDALSKREKWLYEILGEEIIDEIGSRDLFKGNYTPSKMLKITEFLRHHKKHRAIPRIAYDLYLSHINEDIEYTRDSIVAFYDAAILEFDSEVIGPLLEYLKESGLYERTMIVICADHGEEFGEHGKLGFHGDTLYDEVTYVPLIIRIPWIKQGREIHELTATVDIMPTILDSLGIPAPEHVQGKSLLPLAIEEAASPFRKYTFGRLPMLSSIRSKEWKFILDPEGKRELFHIPSDPEEQDNLYLEKPEIAIELETELKKWEDSLPVYRDEERDFLPGISPETQEKIKRTGYW